VSKQHSHAARQFALLAFSHVVDLIGDVICVDSGEISRTQ
jgi:hypothetical protein